MRKSLTLSVALLCLSFHPALAADAPATRPIAPASRPAAPSGTKDGLAAIAQASKPTFRSDEPIVVDLTFRNISKQPFRLPQSVQPPPVKNWLLRLWSLETGKTYTGDAISADAAPLAAEPSDPLAPIQILPATAIFRDFVFMEGDLGGGGAADFRKAATTRPAAASLPGGRYAVSVVILFPPAPPSGSSGPRVAQIWSGREIVSTQFDLAIRTIAPQPKYATTPDSVRAAKTLVENLRTADAAYLNSHTGLRNDMAPIADGAAAYLESIAKQPADPAESARLLGVLDAAIDRAIERAESIATRGGESEPNQDKARDIQAKLRGLKNREK